VDAYYRVINDLSVEQDKPVLELQESLKSLSMESPTPKYATVGHFNRITN